MRKYTPNKTIPNPPDGFSYFPNFISKHQELLLLKHIKKLAWQEIKMHGVIAKRKVVHYGFDYSYDTRTITPTSPPPLFLDGIISQTEKLLHGPRIDEILITQYLPWRRH